MSVSPNPIAMAIVMEQCRQEQFAQASRYRLATLAQKHDGIGRRQRRADRQTVAAIIALALALTAGCAAADVSSSQARPSHVYPAHAAAEAQASDSPHVGAVQKVREAAR